MFSKIFNEFDRTSSPNVVITKKFKANTCIILLAKAKFQLSFDFALNASNRCLNLFPQLKSHSLQYIFFYLKNIKFLTQQN